MIVLKITNSSEVVAAKAGRLIERFTPEGLDQATVEDIVVRRLVENLAAEGIRGEVVTVRGLDLEGSELVLHNPVHVRQHRTF